MTDFSDLIAPMRDFSLMRKGPAPYFLRVATSEHDVTRVGGWMGVFDARAVSPQIYESLITDCRFAAVRRRAVEYFQGSYQHKLAMRAASVDAPTLERALASRQKAQLAVDAKAMAESEIARFLADAQPSHLLPASIALETSEGWRASVALTIQSIAGRPFATPLFLKLLQLAEGSRQADLMESVSQLYSESGVLAHLAEVGFALAHLIRGDFDATLAKLDGIDSSATISKSLAFCHSLRLRYRTDALEKKGEFAKAFATTLEYNRLDMSQQFDKKDFYTSVEQLARLPIPELPPDQNTNQFQMLGFPRSGTTLLENALAAHPLIETLEEVPSQNATMSFIESVQKQQRARPSTDIEYFAMARDRYYAEIARRRKNPNASVIIDKLPIRSANAEFLRKLFPQKRYIFSVRHPFDVALSCLRQQFGPNPAMENFHTIADAAKVYDFTMTQWFAHFAVDDPAVHYVRYDRLVTDFENVAGGVLAFLGLDWSDDVRDFARKAETRRAATPSYTKVRQGLTIGVQSNWRKYGFVFQSADARPLFKWAEFFQYETE